MSGVYTVVGDWLAEYVDGCTCGMGPTGYQHEPMCGLEPIDTVDNLLTKAYTGTTTNENKED